MEKKRAAWFCLHVSLPAECSCWTAYVHAVTPSVSGSPGLWGGCRWQFTKGLSNAQSRSAWLEAGKRNSNSTERKKVKTICSFESSKLLPVWYWAVKQTLQINFQVAVFPTFFHQRSHSLHGLFSLTFCLALSRLWQQVNDDRCS